jgi:hypothetical protein
MVFMDFGCGLDFVRQAQTKHYLKTSGFIVKSWIETNSKTRSGLNVQYVYEVDGKTYQSDRLRYIMVAPEAAEEAIVRYPAGAKVIVFYDSSTPSLCVLQVGLEAGDFSALFILVLLSILVIIGCLHFWRYPRKPLILTSEKMNRPITRPK